MYFINSCKKLKFSLPIFLIILLFVVSVTFGTIGSAADLSFFRQTGEGTSLLQFFSNKGITGEATDRLNLTAINNGSTNENQAALFDVNATFTVTSLNDAGAGSLRKAIADANAAAGDDIITFDPTLTGTITLTGGELLINSNISISKTGTGTISVSGNNASRVFSIASGAVVSINNISIINGKAEGTGGGILNVGTLTLTNSTVSGNTVVYTGAVSGKADGGGIYNFGSLSLQSTTLKNNTAQVINLGSANGGGLSNAGTTVVTNSSVISNNLIGKPDAFGGGIFNNGTLSVINSTVGNNSAAANAASSKGQGGGLYNNAPGTLTIRNSTVSFNTADAMTADGGGIYAPSGTSVTISNTIVSSNNTNNNGTASIRDFSGIAASEGNNLISNSTGSTGWVSSDKLDQPALLAVLGNYGGPTQTFGLLPNSPAVNAGNNTNAPATDQRGAARIIGGTIDIGSFENNPTGAIAAIPNGTVGTAYNQNLAVTQPSTLTFAVISGTLPPGLTLTPAGNLTGNPTTGGRFSFVVSITDSSGSVNFKDYSLFIPFAITNLNDSGAGSLRKAIVDANNTAGDDTITFQPGLSGTLTLAGELSINSNINIVGTGAGNLIISGNNASRIFNIAANSIVNISGANISQGKAEGSGAGILNAGTLNLTNVVVTDNTAAYSGTSAGSVGGGGISNSGTLTLLNSTVKNNTAQVTNLGTADGGGISNTGTATLTNSTVSSNVLLGKPTANGGGISNNGTFNISNSTIGNNTATANSAASGSPTAQGGGIWNGSQGMLTIRNTTIGFNAAAAATANGGGIFNTTGGTVTIGSTIASDDTTVINGVTTIKDTAGAYASEGKNLVSNSTGSTGWISGDKLNQPALLTPLGSYGGPTQTFGLLPNSQAINAGNNTNAPATDQRGAARIIGGTIDIGSFENNVTGVLSAIPNTSVGGTYSQSLAVAQPSTLTFSIADGALPPGLAISTDGVITGSATTGGTFNFTVAVADANGFVGYKQYTLVVTCTYSINPTSQSFSGAGGFGTVDAIANSGCSYTIFTNNAAFITVTTSSVGNGNTTVGFTVAANTGPARTGSITIANLVFTINQDSGCAYTLSAASASIAAGGGTGGFNVVSESGCSWTAVSNASWITVNTASGTGNGPVTFSVAANTGPARTGTITVGGQTFTVNQASGCSYMLNPPLTGFDASGGTGSFAVSTASNCPYTAVSSSPWITINSGGSGTGNGSVTFTVAANTGTARTGTITVGTQTFTVNQASGCTYSISVAVANFSEIGGNGSVNVSTGSGCTWTAVSNVSWITISSGASGAGGGTVNFVVASNSGAPRTGTLTIAGQTFTVNQTGCEYILSPGSTNFSSSGGSGSFTVTATPGCGWTAVSSASWISIVSGAATGNGSVTFSVQSNIGPARTGTININGQTFTVSQAGGCSYSLFPIGASFPASAGSSNFNLNVGAGCQWTAVSNVPWLTVTSPGSGTGSVLVTFSAQTNTGAARSGTITVGGLTFTVTQAAGTSASRVAFDFDGDGKADISVFRPTGGFWYLLNSASGFAGSQFGDTNDKIVPADYDGDGKTDLAVYRGGTWYLQRSSQGFIGFSFGAADDIPQPADFDGDGKADLAVWRPSNGTWYVFNLATNQFTSFQFGAGTDKPVVGDYDGDGKADYAVFRPSNGTWYIQRSQLGFTGIQFGDAADKPVPADYDGDGKTDVAVFRPSNGTWYQQRSTAGFAGVQFGVSTDLPTPADYDGDGKADIAVYRSGTWYLLRTTAGFLGTAFGAATDKPAPNAYIP